MGGRNCTYTQYPFKRPDFNDEFAAFVVSVKESEAEKEKHSGQQGTEGDNPLTYFKVQCRIANMPHRRDLNVKSSSIMPASLENKLDGRLMARNL